MPAANIIQLRQLLTERFPGLRTRAEELTPRTRSRWPSGLPQLDELLQGGLPRGALTEIIAEPHSSSGALLLHGLLRRASMENQLTALIDGSDSFEVTRVDENILSRLLWVRCRSVEEALKAADLLLRDGNLPLILLDLAFNPSIQLRKTPATTWYRLQRIVEQTSAACAIFTPCVSISPAQARITVRSRFSLGALDQDPVELLRELNLEISETRRGMEKDAHHFA